MWQLAAADLAASAGRSGRNSCSHKRWDYGPSPVGSWSGVTVDHASCHRDCRYSDKSGRLLIVFDGLLQVDPACRAAPARVDAAGGRCTHLDWPSLQNPLRGQRDAPRGRIYGQLCHDRIPAGNSPCSGHPNPRQSRVIGNHEDRTQSGVRAATACCTAAPGQADAAEAEETQSCGTGPGRISVPRPRPRRAAASRLHPLVA